MPPTRAQVYRRRRLAVFGGAGALLVAGTYLPMTLLAPLDPAVGTVMEAVAPATTSAELAWPQSAAIGIGALGFPGVLAATGSTEALPMASITKLVTALTVLDHHPISLDDHGPSIQYTSADTARYFALRARNAAVEPVVPGTAHTLYQALQAVLIPSAANYTQSLTDWAFGSEEAFAAAAMEWLAANGLDDVTVVEPTGLSPSNRGTVEDLIELGRIALAHPVLAEIVATREVTLPGIGTVENTNDLLGTLGIDGIKTGTLPEAGACLLFSADLEIEGETVTIIGVALGGVRHHIQNPQIEALVHTVQAGFHSVPLVEAGHAFASYRTEWGAQANAIAAESRSALVWGDAPISYAVHVDPVGVAQAGAAVGTLSITVEQELIEVPLVTDADMDDPGPFWRLGNPGLLFD